MTVNETDCVILSINTFNKYKNVSVKADLVIDRLFDLARMDSNIELRFDSDSLRDLLKLAYPQRYENRIKELNETKVCSISLEE